MPEAEGLSPEQQRLGESAPFRGIGVGAGMGDEWLGGPDRGREHAALYAVLFALLVAGSILLRRNLVWDTDSTTHTISEATATLLAFIIGGLALVRYYSRKQIIFLFIGCGFLGAGLLDLNHALSTSDGYVAARM